MASSPLSINSDIWERELRGDPDRDYILAGIREGFYITKSDAGLTPVQCRNYSSTTCPENKSRVESQIRREIELGRYYIADQKPTIISALGAIPKPGSSEFRLVHDCSRPVSKSLNSYADPDSHSFVTVDKAAKLTKPNYFLCKVDLRQAYRHAALHPSQYKMTGLQWHFSGDPEPTVLFDARLPFGASESVGCFHRITQSVVRMMRKRVNCSVLCYIDDFLIISENYSQCVQSMDILTELLTNLGFDISWNKCVKPTQKLSFLGINLDSVSGTMSIPPSKLQETIHIASLWHNKQKATKREIQSLIGRISWIAKCVKAIRPILRSLIDLQKRLKRATHRIRIPQHVKTDLRYLNKWCVQFNGVVFFPRDSRPRPDTTVYTDSSLAAGAAYCNGDFIYSNWTADDPRICNEPIFVKELAAVLLAYRRWCRRWQNRTVHVYTDNKGVEWSLRRGLTRNVQANCILKEILWLSAYFNVTTIVHYINTVENCLADAISRLDNYHHLMRAATLLAKAGVHILHPIYNILNHMTHGSFVFLFKSYRCRKNSLMLTSEDTDGRHMPTTQRRPTDVRGISTSGSANTSATNQFPSVSRHWSGMWPYWPDPYYQQVSCAT